VAKLSKFLAPRPWRVDRKSAGKQWRDSCTIVDADGGDVAHLTRGFQGDKSGNGCPSWDNAQLIVDAVNSYTKETAKP